MVVETRLEIALPVAADAAVVEAGLVARGAGVGAVASIPRGVAGVVALAEVAEGAGAGAGAALGAHVGGLLAAGIGVVAIAARGRVAGAGIGEGHRRACEYQKSCEKELLIHVCLLAR